MNSIKWIRFSIQSRCPRKSSKLDSARLRIGNLHRKMAGGYLSVPESNDINWYNDSWGSQGKFLPMPIKGTQGNLQNELSFSKISSSYFEHPALSMFNDPRNGSLAEAQIKKWIVMDESKSEMTPR